MHRGPVSDNTWQNVFQHWPSSLPKHGLLVTTFGETIQFVNFLVSSTAVLVERDKPDSVNARKVIVDYGAISAVKIADPADIARYQVLGFQPPL
jgi:hypothetical protein